MVGLDDRKRVVGYILEAVKSGASKIRACETIELNMRTFQRWFDGSRVQCLSINFQQRNAKQY